jgi:hypothetical protein
MQAPQGAPELEDRRVDRETRHYRVEYGRVGDTQCRVISRRTKTLTAEVQTWFEMRQRAVHAGLPHCEVYSTAPQEPPQQIIETWQGTIRLDRYFSERSTLLSELSAVYLTLQTATVIDYLTQLGADVSNLGEKDFVVDERIEGLPKLTYIGWQPTDETQAQLTVGNRLHLIARVLYQCLTGSLPPSHQVPDSLSDDSSSNLGFDDLLMNWVTEECDLGILGSYALQALDSAQTNDGIIDFIRTVYPHLQQASQLAINEATQNLASERRLLQSVEKHRAKLKELRTRHQYLSGWLIDHEPDLDEGSRALEETQAYVQDFERYAQTLSGTVRQGFNPTTSGWDSTGASEENPSLEASAQTEEPLSFTELAEDLEDNLEFQAPGNATHSTLPVPTKIVSRPMDANRPAEDDLSPTEPNAPSPVKVFVLVVLSATILGVFFAWSLLSSTSYSESSNDSVFYQKDTK